MNTIYNIIFLIIGIILGYFLDKTRVKKEEVAKLTSLLVNKKTQVGESKEVNSLLRPTDNVNTHHNSYFDED